MTNNNKFISKLSLIICKYANNDLLLHTVSVKFFTRKLSNSKIISLPGLPYGQLTWGAFSIYTPSVLSCYSNPAL